jgi:hypothetical protein
MVLPDMRSVSGQYRSLVRADRAAGKLNAQL